MQKLLATLPGVHTKKTTVILALHVIKTKTKEQWKTATETKKRQTTYFNNSKPSHLILLKKGAGETGSLLLHLHFKVQFILYFGHVWW